MESAVVIRQKYRYLTLKHILTFAINKVSRIEGPIYISKCWVDDGWCILMFI
jgi:hypothetical protein